MDKTNAKEKRRLKKLYLDKRKASKMSYTSNPSNNSTSSSTHYNPKEKRRLRKQYLDNRKARQMLIRTVGKSILTTNVLPGNENASSSSFQSSTHRNPSSNIICTTPLSNISNGTPAFTSLYNSDFIASYHQHLNFHNLRSVGQTTFHNPTTLNCRTPLSNITNVMSTCNGNRTTPSLNSKYYSLFSNSMSSSVPSTNVQSLSSTRLSSGKHKFTKKNINPSAIPMIDLTTEEETIHQHITQQNNIGISKDYLDHGDQTIICQMCNAKLWKDEAVRGKKHGNTSFSLCCAYGNVELPSPKQPPPAYQQYFSSESPKNKYFLKNIRRYNSMFAFTSMGGKVDKSINRGNAPYVFRLSGQNYHSLGSLLPEHGSRPKFSQLYIYDTDNETTNRQSCFRGSNNSSTSNTDPFDNDIIEELKVMLDTNNKLVQCYRMVRDCFHANPQADLKLRLIGRREKDGRTYNLPTASEVAALIVGDITGERDKRDIIVQNSSGSTQRICELHPSYLPLQYPLIFPYGDDGYRVDIFHRYVTSASDSKRPYTTMREYFAYKIQDRINQFSLILKSKRLFQQFLVDVYTMIESERLFFIRNQQKVLRSETYENLKKVHDQGNGATSTIGQRVILPSSFTGGARYMMQNYLDAMAICKSYGYPDFFITVTCNPKWPEMKRFLQDTTLHPEDRPDIVCRLFKIKLDALIKDLKDNEVFGKVQAVVYTIEFQKRGLPHSHICIFMHPDFKLRTVDQVDPIIAAEIPNIDEDPELYTLVSEFMMHGPCGAHNLKCPCMVDNKCSKKFPKKYMNRTSVDDKGYALYRRRDNKSFIEKSGVQLDNRYVVPYNKYLLKRYQAHINVEWCNQGTSIKYLFKYINKGPDRATMVLEQSNSEDNDVDKVDEVKKFLDCRYVSACEASWRIFGYDVHYRTPSVVRLPFHLPGQQQLVFSTDDDLHDVINNPSVACSMFLGWMKCNQIDPVAKTLTYVEFPTKFVWKSKDRVWVPRKKGLSIGRIHMVSPNHGEAYFLRILLNKVVGPTSFEDILTVNGVTYPTFRDACYSLGLLDDDKEYIDAIKEASHSGSGFYLRSLFATMLITNSLSRPESVWNNAWEYLSDGILYTQQQRLNNPGLELTEDQIKNLTLYEIEKNLLRNNSSLKKFPTMPYPDDDSISSSNNRLITEELAYDLQELQKEFENLSLSLTDEQRLIFNDIMEAVEHNNGGVFFVYGYGGTGKTFLWKTLSSAIRSKGEIVLNVASSGIASLLLTGGRTAHSRFHIPLNLNEDSLCFIKPGSELAMLLQKTKLIIWDEAPMVNKHAFEALDRSLKDILSIEVAGNSKLPFGGKVVVFGGDFRQILPVVPHGSRQDIVNASLSSSYLWTNCKVCTLTKNMRLTVGKNATDVQNIREFANWLLDIGEGKLGGNNDGEATIHIPEGLLITNSADPIGSLIDFVYPSIVENSKIDGYFQERAILASKLDVVQEINDRLIDLFPGEQKEYLSSDSLCPEESTDKYDENSYSPDVLNGFRLSGIPNHKLVLKVGVPVMLLQNIDQKNGLCNGTRLQVVSLGNRVIEAVILSGTNIGTRTFIPRMSLTPSDKRIPFKFKRRQFPLSLCFAMTINKSQGQSLSTVGLFLRQPVFSHGQLYVALSRVTSKDGLKLLILDNDNQVTNTTTNVVYKEVFRNLK